jgi:hypothetical protein
MLGPVNLTPSEIYPSLWTAIGQGVGAKALRRPSLAAWGLRGDPSLVLQLNIFLKLLEWSLFHHLFSCRRGIPER